MSTSIAGNNIINNNNNNPKAIPKAIPKATQEDNYIYYDVVPIDIMLYKTLPGEKSTKLTSSIIYDPERTSKVVLSDNPFFTDNIKLPYGALYKMPYQERVNFFFNEEEFRRIIQIFILKKLIRNEDKTPENRYKIAKENLQKMIQLLFSTSIPATGNITNTFDEFIKHDTNINISTRVLNNVPKYTYLKSGQQVYTITKVRLINDILNHPLYNGIIGILLNFNEWRKTQKMTIDIGVNATKLDLFKRLVSTGTNSLDITEYLDDFINLITKNEELLKNSDRRIVSSDITLLGQLLNNIKTNIEEIKTLKKSNISDAITNGVNNNTIDNVLFEQVEKLIIEIKDSFTKYKNKNKEDIPTRITLFDNKFQQIIKYLNTIEIQEKIRDKYFGDNPYFNFSGESDEIKEKIKKDFGKLFEFIDKIKEITMPKRMTINSKLQTMIKNFIDSNDEKEEGECSINSLITLVTIINDEMIVNPNKKKCLKGSKKDLLNTELIIVDKQRYEVYLAIDTIEAEVNIQNAREYLCIYRDFMLTRMAKSIFEFSKKKYFLDDNRIILTKEEISKCKKCKFSSSLGASSGNNNKPNSQSDKNNAKLNNKTGGIKSKHMTKNTNNKIKQKSFTRKLKRNNGKHFYYLN